MGIAEETVTVRWRKLPRSIKIFGVTITLFLLSLIRVPLSTVYVGFSAGECFGICRVDYRITANEIIIDRYNNATEKAHNEVIRGDFNELKFGVPLILMLHPIDFGCPDCDDGGTYKMGFNFCGIHFNQLFEIGKEPWYFKDMGNIVKDRLSKIDAISPNKD